MKNQWWIGLPVFVISGCVAGTKPELEQMTAGDDDGAGSSSTGLEVDDGNTSMPNTTAQQPDTDGDESSGGDTCGFICPPDMGPIEDCDVWAQDCPDGQKCMPWANDGGNSWNSLKCVEVNADAGQPGDECHVEGSGVSGLDDCALGSMCWNTNEEGLGTCVAFCGGTEAAPVCDDPQSSCVIANDGVLTLCLPLCDPLVQDCGPEEACYPVNDGFACAPEESGETGGNGDPCEFLNVCDPGLFCANASAMPDCQDSTGCCTNFCDLNEGNTGCSGAGVECVAWYDVGQAPPGLEQLGACLIPE
ncbi:MAG: ribulose phosphate epimerase [Deltaproteobacteria bacterium]|nr:ribulose phosphate epimerase [Deltaproteobacteria bacterium]MBP7289774.1 ribulose phosphate epimerase [Nannocystaceae bacterium]